MDCRIWKYVLEVTDMQPVEMPKGAELLSVVLGPTKQRLRLVCLAGFFRENVRNMEQRSRSMFGLSPQTCAETLIPSFCQVNTDVEWLGKVNLACIARAWTNVCIGIRVVKICGFRFSPDKNHLTATGEFVRFKA